MRNIIQLVILLAPGLAVQYNCIAQQADSSKMYYSIKDLHPLDATGSGLLTGDFTISNGFGGWGYTIDSFKRCTRYEFGCTGPSELAKGVVRFTNKAELQVTEKKNRYLYRVYQFDKYLFLIEADKTQQFMDAFASKADEQNKRPSSAGDCYLCADAAMIAFNLSRHFLTKLD